MVLNPLLHDQEKYLSYRVLALTPAFAGIKTIDVLCGHDLLALVCVYYGHASHGFMVNVRCYFNELPLQYQLGTKNRH